MKRHVLVEISMVTGLVIASFSSFSSPQKTINTSNAKHQPSLPVVSIVKDKDGVLPGNPWFVGLGVGWMSPFGTNATNYAYSGMPGFPDDRFDGNDSKSSPQYSVFAGYQWRQNNQWLPAYSLSLNYTYISSAEISGVIFINNLPDSRNFTYKYDISQQTVLAKFKADLYQWQQFMPYLSAGAGVSFNRTHNYSDSPIPGATLLQRRYGFNSATRSQFAGTVGAGIDYWFNDRSQISLGYELAYYGKVRTGNGQSILSANRLENKMNSNAIVLQGVYFFERL